jgi:hypothetical protein
VEAFTVIAGTADRHLGQALESAYSVTPAIDEVQKSRAQRGIEIPEFWRAPE